MKKQEMGNQELTHKQKQDITDIFNRIFNKPLNKSYYTIKNDIILDGIEFSNIKEELKIKMGIFYKQLFCYLCNFIHPETGCCKAFYRKIGSPSRKTGLPSRKTESLWDRARNFVLSAPLETFDLINEKEQIFIKLKTDWNTDNHNAKESKFCLLNKYKRNNSNAKVYYICLNDKRKVHVDSRRNFVLSSVPERQQEQTLGISRSEALSVDYTHHFGFQIITGMKAWEFFCQRAGIDAINLINYLKALVHGVLVLNI